MIKFGAGMDRATPELRPPGGHSPPTLWPLLLALLLLGVSAAWAVRASLSLTGGHLVYALDDPYIHLAIAKNFVRHGVWGTTPWEFTSATSSPVWTLLLAACDRLFGVGERLPLFLNLGFAALFLVAAHDVLRRFGLRPAVIAALLAAEVLLVPIVPVVMCGLEHFLHLTAAVLFLWLAAREDPARTSARGFAALAAASVLVVAARYEGMFLVAGAVLLLLVRRRFWRAIALMATAALPMVAYGLWSMRHGWAFLPSSVLLKAGVSAHGLPNLAEILGRWRHAVASPHRVIMLLGGGLIAFRQQTDRSNERAARMMFLTLVAMVLHFSFAGLGYFYRYEAYLVALWILSVGCSGSSVVLEPGSPLATQRKLPLGTKPPLPRVATLAAMAALLAAPLLASRGLVALAQTPRASRNIFEQQFQMACFLGTFYAGRRVIANDVGLINFLTDLDNLDLEGLTTREIMWDRLARRFDNQRMAEIAATRKMEIAIVYDAWYAPLPAGWSKRGEWTIEGLVSAAKPTVSFYAVTPADVDRLDASLRAFAPRLPPTVAQSGTYLP